MTNIFILLALGLVAGICSGMVGIGGGLIIVPALVYFLGFTQQSAQGVSLTMFLLPIGILGVYNYYKGGHINSETIRFALIMCITFVAGSYFGSKIAIGLNQEILRKVFGAFVLLVALKMIFGK
ncbi:MAG: sulfite exporter TauE/SafE family protein [Bacteroidetes bacterium]|nr:sulfite exporter TauE/SafE family protein [Bacteroidota bacterium]